MNVYCFCESMLDYDLFIYEVQGLSRHFLFTFDVQLHLLKTKFISSIPGCQDFPSDVESAHQGNYHLESSEVLLPPDVLLVFGPHGCHHVVEVHHDMHERVKQSEES